MEAVNECRERDLHDRSWQTGLAPDPPLSPVLAAALLGRPTSQAATPPRAAPPRGGGGHPRAVAGAAAGRAGAATAASSSSRTRRTTAPRSTTTRSGWSGGRLLAGRRAAGDGKARREPLRSPARPTCRYRMTLAGAPGVTVATAMGLAGAGRARRRPTSSSPSLARAAAGTAERIADLQALLDRGGGFVAVHSAVITSPSSSGPLADVHRPCLGGRHDHLPPRPRGAPASPPAITPSASACRPRSASRTRAYWPLVGDRTKVEVLATADERVRGPEDGSAPRPQPMLWTTAGGKGRVYRLPPRPLHLDLRRPATSDPPPARHGVGRRNLPLPLRPAGPP